MAIDAVITGIENKGDDLVIRLGERVYTDAVGKIVKSIPGRERFIIEEFTYTPKIGQYIWGGSDTIRLENNVPGSEKREYSRAMSGVLWERLP